MGNLWTEWDVEVSRLVLRRLEQQSLGSKESQGSDLESGAALARRTRMRTRIESQDVSTPRLEDPDFGDSRNAASTF